MFLPELLLGGNPLTGAVGGLACCAVAVSAVYAMRKKIPHPTEFSCIGCCYLRGGCHQHPKFNLIVEAHEAANVPKGSNVYLYIECGRFDRQSQDNPVDKKTMEVPIFERLNIHIRQMDNILKVSLWRKGTLSSTLLGELDLDVVADIIEKDYPQLEWYTLKKEGKSTVKVRLSFHRLDTDLDSGVSPLIQHAMIHAAREAAAKGETFHQTFDELDDKAKLRFLSRVLEGPLKLMGLTGWKEFYFKAVEGSRERWQWVYWSSKEAMQRGDKPKGKVPLLAISLVLADTHNRQQFYVKYHTKSGARDLFLSRVDRDRDLWSDGLYEFLERLRAYLTDHPPESDAQIFAQGKKLEQDGNKCNTFGRRFLIDPTRRGLEQPFPTRKKRLPAAVAAMIEEAMEGYEEDNDDNVKKPASADDYPLFGQEDAMLRSGSTGGPL